MEAVLKHAAEEVHQEARCEQLEAEITSAEARIAELKAQRDGSGAAHGRSGDREEASSPARAFAELAQQLASTGGTPKAAYLTEGSDETACIVVAEEVARHLNWCVPQLSIINHMVRRRIREFDERERNLKEAERAAIARSWAHLPPRGERGSALQVMQSFR